ncbi:hypothetical protein SAMN06297144_3012 [Sphingomonas guangdongensis]|uniref:Uncharacterized protein n=2 Tax=Sphingomonas guangdongensis TaxID=1141890 RepID=A0A285R1W8_9SPHN|nr:hypothetical protein SAMN06297144_3012 [Sphingomonas guangdongensis]
MPSFSPGEPASSAIAKVEAFCGIKPGTAFEEQYPGLVSVRRDFLTVPMQPAAECLFYAMAAIDTEQLGFKFGFIGNEVLPKEKK